MVEELLEFLVCEVDTQLLKAVELGKLRKEIKTQKVEKERRKR